MFTRIINLNINLKGYDMATLEDISNTLAGLPAAIATAVVAALPAQTVDATGIETAITASTTAIIAEIKSGVEGTAPAAPPA